jgi:hypothetical protein
MVDRLAIAAPSYQIGFLFGYGDSCSHRTTWQRGAGQTELQFDDRTCRSCSGHFRNFAKSAKKETEVQRTKVVFYREADGIAPVLKGKG